MHTFLPNAYFQGKITPFSQANISIATHALHYGTAVWGGIRAIYNSEKDSYLIFRLPDHIERLVKAATFLEYEISQQEIEEKIISFVHSNREVQTDMYIRPMVYTSDLGIVPRVHNMEKDFLIMGLELADYFDPDKKLKLCFSSWMRQEDVSLPLRGKVSGAYITSSMAKSEAYHRGFDDAILMNSSHKVSEGTGANIFMYKNNELVTTPVTNDILEGITRKSVIQIARDNDITVVERDIDKTELLLADEVFLTGTAAKITAVGSIEQYTLPEQNLVTQKLSTLYNTIITGGINSDSPYSHWITHL